LVLRTIDLKSKPRPAIATGGAAVIGVSLWLTLAWLLPRVEVLPVSRARRALDVLYKGVR
jgi:hypothetical protein